MILNVMCMIGGNRFIKFLVLNSYCYKKNFFNFKISIFYYKGLCNLK